MHQLLIDHELDIVHFANIMALLPTIQWSGAEDDLKRRIAPLKPVHDSDKTIGDQSRTSYALLGTPILISMYFDNSVFDWAELDLAYSKDFYDSEDYLDYYDKYVAHYGEHFRNAKSAVIATLGNPDSESGSDEPLNCAWERKEATFRLSSEHEDRELPFRVVLRIHPVKT